VVVVDDPSPYSARNYELPDLGRNLEVPAAVTEDNKPLIRQGEAKQTISGTASFAAA
jgi:hypothetical protein